MLEVPKIVFRIDREHEARAIRARRAAEAEQHEGFGVLAWFRPRDTDGRFQKRGVA